MKRALMAAVAATAIGRFMITPRLELPTSEGSYEAFAHLFVGWLFGVSWVWMKQDAGDHWRIASLGNTLKKCIHFQCAIGLSMLELVAFLVQKNQ